MEIWKDIPGYEGVYQISNIGRVKSLSRYVARGRAKNPNVLLPERILAIKINRGGYQVVHLRTNKNLYPTVHKLVAMVFIDNPLGKPTVNHINGIKADNRVENLEWSTHSEQMIHAIETGLYVQPDISKYTTRGSANPISKIKEEDIPEIKRMRESGATYKSIGEHFGLGISQVFRICKNQSWNWMNNETTN